jgi:hypothetical protein
LTFGQLARAPVVLARGAEPPGTPAIGGAARPFAAVGALKYRRAPFLTGPREYKTFADTYGQTDNGHVCHAGALCAGQSRPIHATLWVSQCDL